MTSDTRFLADKSLVIVGGTSGLGLSAAKACVRAGANVVVVGRSKENRAAALKQLGSHAVGLRGDAADPSTAQQAVALCVEAFGRLDGLYHVAGGSGRHHGDGPLDAVSDQGWAYTLQINLNSLFYSNRSATQQFLAQASGGTILNMSSVLGFSPAPEFFATHAYAAAKAAAIGLTKSCAAYYAKQQIRFNALCPALVDTPMAQRATTNPQIMSYIRQKQPLDGGRVGTPEDLDQAVVYLLSDAARFVTGQVLAVDGGWSVSEG